MELLLYSLRNRLFVIFTLLVTIPLIAMFWIFSVKYDNILIQDIESSSLQTTNQYAISLSGYISQVEEIAYQVLGSEITQNWLASRNQLQPHPADQALKNKIFRDYLSSVADNHSLISFIGVYTNRGIWSGDESFVNTKWYRNYKDAKIPWTGSHMDPDQAASSSYSKIKVNSFIYPLTELRIFSNMGIIKINIATEKLLQPLDSIKFGESGRLYLIDEQGTPILGQTIAREELIRTELDKINKGTSKQGIVRVSYNGTMNLIIYQKIDSKPWVLIGEVPERELFSEVRVIKQGMIFVIIIVLLVSVILTFGASTSITKPLSRFIVSMKHLELGDFMKARSSIPEKLSGHSELSFFKSVYLNMIRRLENYIRREFELNLLRRNAEYRALLLQINPHFLYNTLELIGSLSAVGKNEEVMEVTEFLGQMLRYSLRLDSDIVYLEEEFEYIGNFAAVLKSRFEDRLDFKISNHAATKGVKVIKLLLQPLVENAVKYSMDHADVAIVEVEADIRDEKCRISVKDNGVGMSRAMIMNLQSELKNRRILDMLNPDGSKIGLRNVLARCSLQYGDNLEVDIKSEEGQGTEITIDLPYSKGNEQHV
ncbi:sensor histidine kinase [Paenibacillaceae bacterium WGS1546]|uniref:cache domain-containing sensor histidine kinase n=1 Tax=Cohnella sp. WGS1546 TaxID=3366810 RepID=UPI00372D4FFD